MRCITKDELLSLAPATHHIRSWSGIIDPKTDVQLSVDAVCNLKSAPHEPQYGLFKWFIGSKCFVDIGANCGQSIASIKLVAPDARIDSYEPNPISFHIAKLVASRFPACRVHNFGLGEKSAQVMIYTPVIDGLLVTPLTSMDASSFEAGGKMHEFVTQKIAQGSDVTLYPQEIEIRGGDSLGLSPDVMKIDAEGAEMSILTGLQQTIGVYKPLLMIEKSDPALVANLLYSHGYRSFAWDHFISDPPPGTLREIYIGENTSDYSIPLNIFYAHKEKTPGYENQYGLSFAFL